MAVRSGRVPVYEFSFHIMDFRSWNRKSIFILNTVILGLNIWFFRDYLRSKTYSFEYKSIQIRYSQNETLHSTWLEFMKDRDQRISQCDLGQNLTRPVADRLLFADPLGRLVFSILHFIYSIDNTTAHSIVDNNAYNFMQISSQERVFRPFRAILTVRHSLKVPFDRAYHPYGTGCTNSDELFNTIRKETIAYLCVLHLEYSYLCRFCLLQFYALPAFL